MDASQPFDNLIGQNSTKRKLRFYLETYQKTKVFPFLNFVGAAGLGKTRFVRELSEYVVDGEGKKKPFIEINCSTIKSATAFFEQVFIPNIHGQEVTILFDEWHAAPKDLMMAFLTIFNTETGNLRHFNYKDSVLEFDFTRQTFFFATTESHLIFKPLRDRLTVVDFVDYSKSELAKIFCSYLPNISFDPEALDLLAETSRGNARNCVLRAKEVEAYCARDDIQHFTLADAKEVCNILDILPHGLNKIEMAILRILRQEGRCTLTMLAAKTGLSRGAIQRDHEAQLMKLGLIVIDGQRGITVKGCKVVDGYKV